VPFFARASGERGPIGECEPSQRRVGSGTARTAATQAVDAPGHDDIELAARRGLAEGIGLRTLVPALGTADAMVAVDLGDLAARVAGGCTGLRLTPVPLADRPAEGRGKTARS
jgi:hypothetical protein